MQRNIYRSDIPRDRITNIILSTQYKSLKKYSPENVPYRKSVTCLAPQNAESRLFLFAFS